MKQFKFFKRLWNLSRILKFIYILLPEYMVYPVTAPVVLKKANTVTTKQKYDISFLQ